MPVRGLIFDFDGVIADSAGNGLARKAACLFVST
jgi:phosphoglycolate phosphatase-like HAD superfamily hydrolase